MILSDPEDFRIENHDFSCPASNCLKRVIEGVQNVKITVFQQLPQANRFFVIDPQWVSGAERSSTRTPLRRVDSRLPQFVAMGFSSTGHQPEAGPGGT